MGGVSFGCTRQGWFSSDFHLQVVDNEGTVDVDFKNVQTYPALIGLILSQFGVASHAAGRYVNTKDFFAHIADSALGKEASVPTQKRVFDSLLQDKTINKNVIADDLVGKTFVTALKDFRIIPLSHRFDVLVQKFSRCQDNHEYEALSREYRQLKKDYNNFLGEYREVRVIQDGSIKAQDKGETGKLFDEELKTKMKKFEETELPLLQKGTLEEKFSEWEKKATAFEENLSKCEDTKTFDSLTTEYLDLMGEYQELETLAKEKGRPLDGDKIESLYSSAKKNFPKLKKEIEQKQEIKTRNMKTKSESYEKFEEEAKKVEDIIRDNLLKISKEKNVNLFNNVVLPAVNKFLEKYGDNGTNPIDRLDDHRQDAVDKIKQFNEQIESLRKALNKK